MTTPVCPFYLNKVTSLLKGNAVGKLHGTITPSLFRKRGSAIERRAGGRENLMVIATLAEIHRISCVISSCLCGDLTSTHSGWHRARSLRTHHSRCN